ncbi:MAG: DUF2158 domain-containing protein [Deltaproteobacteria bacterium]|nr:DUF2158 domain-containing protein [Deltaproteobacteria bacterium]
MATFKAGDIVRLKSGGPKMTVRSIDTNHGLIYCQWFDNKKMFQESFVPESLELAD